MIKLKRIVLDKKSQLRTIISVLIILAIFSYLFVFADNNSNQITAALIGINNETNTTQLALPAEPGPESALIIPPEISEPETIPEPNLNNPLQDPATDPETIQNEPDSNNSESNPPENNPILENPSENNLSLPEPTIAVPLTMPLSPPTITIKNKLDREIGSHTLTESENGEYQLELSSLTPGTGLGLSEDEAEKKYKILYSTSNDAIMTLEPPSWKFTSGNPATVKMFNCKDEKEFTSLGPWELSPEIQPDGQKSGDKAKKMIMKAMKEGSNFFEWTHKRYKRKDFPATVLLSRVEESGKAYLQATVRDITELKNKNSQLERFTRLAEGRELEMIQLKKKVRELESRGKK